MHSIVTESCGEPVARRSCLPMIERRFPPDKGSYTSSLIRKWDVERLVSRSTLVVNSRGVAT